MIPESASGQTSRSARAAEWERLCPANDRHDTTVVLDAALTLSTELSRRWGYLVVGGVAAHSDVIGLSSPIPTRHSLERDGRPHKVGTWVCRNPHSLLQLHQLPGPGIPPPLRFRQRPPDVAR